MTLLILSIATFFNIVILHWKYKRKRYKDLAIDIAILVTLGSLFGGSIEGLSIATIVSMLISLYLLITVPAPTTGAAHA